MPKVFEPKYGILTNIDQFAEYASKPLSEFQDLSESIKKLELPEKCPSTVIIRYQKLDNTYFFTVKEFPNVMAEGSTLEFGFTDLVNVLNRFVRSHYKIINGYYCLPGNKTNIELKGSSSVLLTFSDCDKSPTKIYIPIANQLDGSNTLHSIERPKEVPSKVKIKSVKGKDDYGLFIDKFPFINITDGYSIYSIYKLIYNLNDFIKETYGEQYEFDFKRGIPLTESFSDTVLDLSKNSFNISKTEDGPKITESDFLIEIDFEEYDNSTMRVSGLSGLINLDIDIEDEDIECLLKGYLFPVMEPVKLTVNLINNHEDSPIMWIDINYLQQVSDYIKNSSELENKVLLTKDNDQNVRCEIMQIIDKYLEVIETSLDKVRNMSK